MTMQIAPYILLGMPFVVGYLGWLSFKLAKKHSPGDASAILIMAAVMAACQLFAGLRLLWLA